MGIVFPSEAVASRWDGALQARLRRAPLEQYLKKRGIAPSPPGASQDSDNIARASVSIVEAGLKLYFKDRADGLAMDQEGTVGHLACLVSHELAELIGQPEAWRIAALVSATRLLTPWIGLNAAACASASAARGFQQGWRAAASARDARISQLASASVLEESTAAPAELSACIVALLDILVETGFARAAGSSRDC
jgi:hypothetical protein